jgi:hypothetical protein
MRAVVDHHVVGRALSRLNIRVDSAEVRGRSPAFDRYDPAVERRGNHAQSNRRFNRVPPPPFDYIPSA